MPRPKRSCGCHSHDGFLLSPEGLAQREFDLPEVDAMQPSGYLDSKGSVSGLRRDENLSDSMIDEQYRRFHNGS